MLALGLSAVPPLVVLSSARLAYVAANAPQFPKAKGKRDAENKDQF